jgi:hypothetical protein
VALEKEKEKEEVGHPLDYEAIKKVHIYHSYVISCP